MQNTINTPKFEPWVSYVVHSSRTKICSTTLHKTLSQESAKELLCQEFELVSRFTITIILIFLFIDTLIILSRALGNVLASRSKVRGFKRG